VERLFLARMALMTALCSLCSRSHIFNGVSLEANSGRFMLCDITDPIARPLIEAEGPENLRETFDVSCLRAFAA
jgi:hypothetical protein